MSRVKSREVKTSEPAEHEHPHVQSIPSIFTFHYLILTPRPTLQESCPASPHTLLAAFHYPCCYPCCCCCCHHHSPPFPYSIIHFHSTSRCCLALHIRLHCRTLRTRPTGLSSVLIHHILPEIPPARLCLLINPTLATLPSPIR